jgi:uncharacterized membrane protein
MEAVLADASRLAASVIEAVAVVVGTYGALEAFVRLLVMASRPPIVFAAQKAVWRRLGTWLLLGLEFELAADIIRSVIAPTWAEIGQLASIAVIRTFLNHFLVRDLERASQPQET